MEQQKLEENHFYFLQLQCRTSSNSTSGSKGDVEYDEVEDEYDKSYRRNSRNSGSGTTRLQRRRSPSKTLNGKPSSGPNQYNTTAYISNGEDNAVNISITSNGNNAHHDISRKPPYNSAQNSNQSKNLQNGKRNTAPNNGANSSTAPNIRGRFDFISTSNAVSFYNLFNSKNLFKLQFSF